MALLSGTAPLAAAAARWTGPGGGGGPPDSYRAIVVGIAAVGLLGAFARVDVLRVAVRVALAGGLVAIVSVVGVPTAGAVEERMGTGALLALSAGVATTGLARLGRSLRAPDPGVAICAFLVLVAGSSSLRFMDPLLERVPIERRSALRQAALRADLATTAAYDVAGHDRLHEPSVYEETTIASVPVELPDGPTAALGWGSVGVFAGGLGSGIAALRRARVRSAGARSTARP